MIGIYCSVGTVTDGLRCEPSRAPTGSQATQSGDRNQQDRSERSVSRGEIDALARRTVRAKAGNAIEKQMLRTLRDEIEGDRREPRGNADDGTADEQPGRRCAHSRQPLLPTDCAANCRCS